MHELAPAKVNSQNPFRFSDPYGVLSGYRHVSSLPLTVLVHFPQDLPKAARVVFLVVAIAVAVPLSVVVGSLEESVLSRINVHRRRLPIITGPEIRLSPVRT